jgi:hypothetical protein
MVLGLVFGSRAGSDTLLTFNEAADETGVCCRLGQLACLPPELLEIVLGGLNVRTLCTARLVCSTFCNASSSFLQAVKLSVKDLRDPDTTLTNFPNLTQVTIGDPDEPLEEADFSLLVDRGVCGLVTHICISRKPTSEREPGPRPILPPLPNLMSMAGRLDSEDGFVLPPALQDLNMWKSYKYGCKLGCLDLDPVVRLTRLTSLVITLKHFVNTSFEAVTLLSALRRLNVRCDTSLIPCVGALTLLTHLEWICNDCVYCPSVDLLPITRLQGLVHLRLGHELLELGSEPVKTVAKITTLESLDLPPWTPQVTAADVLVLTSLSRLTALTISCSKGTCFLERSIERLLDLTLLGCGSDCSLGPLAPAGNSPDTTIV